MKSSYATQPRPSSALGAVQAAPAVLTSAQEPLQEKLPIRDLHEKNLMMVAGEQRIVQHALEKNMLAMTTHFPLSVKLASRGKANHLSALVFVLCRYKWSDQKSDLVFFWSMDAMMGSRILEETEIDDIPNH